MTKHIAVFSAQNVKEIFSGERSCDLWLSKKRIAPFGEVKIGDVVYIKTSGREISGQFLVKKVVYFEGIEKKDFEIIGSYLGGKDKAYFDGKIQAKFATLIFIDRVEQFITSPIRYPKSDSRAWAVVR
jgi:hypothetical protein